VLFAGGSSNAVPVSLDEGSAGLAGPFEIGFGLVVTRGSAAKLNGSDSHMRPEQKENDKKD
jgi:hypothetical protein